MRLGIWLSHQGRSAVLHIMTHCRQRMHPAITGISMERQVPHHN